MLALSVDVFVLLPPVSSRWTSHQIQNISTKYYGYCTNISPFQRKTATWQVFRAVANTPRGRHTIPTLPLVASSGLVLVTPFT